MMQVLVANQAQTQAQSHTHTQPLTRRHCLSCGMQGAAAIALPAVWRSAHAQTARPLRPTPSQTEGPFYPDRMPFDTDFDLLRNGTSLYTQGQAVWLLGSVSDLSGKPVAGAVVEIWQSDNDGQYHHSSNRGRADPAFQGFGKVQVGTDGSYRFHTIRPGKYPGRTPHIHVKVKLAQRELLTTQLYVMGEPANARDGLWNQMSDDNKAALTMPFVQGKDGLQVQFPLIVAV
jgi:protocatechuate 3,4-dioxygenase, beta subunit